MCAWSWVTSSRCSPTSNRADRTTRPGSTSEEGDVAKTLREIASTPIGDIARREPVRVGPDTPLADVVTRLREHRRGAVIVEDEGGIAGICTERDIMMRV